MQKITRKDIMLRLDGVVYIEGEPGRQLANVFIRNNENALSVFRKLAPDIQASDISIDELGRVRINNAKITQVAQALAESEDPSVVGGAISRDPVPADVTPPDTVVTDAAPSDATDAATDVVPADDPGPALEVDFFCRDPSPGGGLDIICGAWDEEGEGCDVDFGCGYFS